MQRQIWIWHLSFDEHCSHLVTWLALTSFYSSLCKQKHWSFIWAYCSHFVQSTTSVASLWRTCETSNKSAVTTFKSLRNDSLSSLHCTVSDCSDAHTGVQRSSSAVKDFSGNYSSSRGSQSKWNKTKKVLNVFQCGLNKSTTNSFFFWEAMRS